MRTRIDQVKAHDGSFDVHVWLPDSGRGPGILLLQEVWGVGPYIRKVAEDLAALGYVVAAPDLFWRVRRNWQGAHDMAGLQASIEVASRFDGAQGVADSGTTLAHLRALPEVTGGVGSLGICLGGSLNFALAADEPMDAVLSFYGSQVPDTLALMERIDAPLLLAFGGQDPYIPRERVAEVERAAAGRPNVRVHVDERAGHAFHNHEAPDFYHEEAAADLWRVAVDFLGNHIPVRP
ncbi:dienelactone hydrolase family protein [Nonomuraea sp. NPDC050540]|uniref:dienelactone hydrolase family protein n=1 Tax=Nonomuraea sp. NPDC050540 TaxID=3364367 RepID=UPI003795332C